MKKGTRIWLIEERKLRNWSQLEVADRLGTNQRNVSRWELGLTTPGSYFRTKLCVLFGKRPEELGLFDTPIAEELRSAFVPDDSQSPLLPSDQHVSHWYVPYPRNAFFIGRDQVFCSLHTLLRQQDSAIPARTCALQGLGGIGKTQIALEYSYRYASAYTAVLWIHAETSEAILASCMSIAEILALPEQHEQSQRKIVRAVTQWLRNQRDWLLIFDNVENLILLQPFLQLLPRGSILLTTQLQATGSIAQQISIDPLSAEEGLAFLLQRAKLLQPGETPTHLDLANLSAAQAIVEAMHGLPLALDQAGAYIEETQCGADAYFQRYCQHRARFLERRGGNSLHHPTSIQTILSLSFQRVERRSPIAAEVLRFCAFLAPEAIPEEVFSLGFAPNSTHLQVLTTEPWLLDEVIAVLGMYSLVRRDPAMKTLSIHRLVQVILQDRLSKQEQTEELKRAVIAINRVFPEVEHATRRQCERLLPHALYCAKQTMCWEQASEELMSLLLKTGLYLKEHAQYQEAEQLLNRVLHLRETMRGISADGILHRGRIGQPQGGGRLRM